MVVVNLAEEMKKKDPYCQPQFFWDKRFVAAGIYFPLLGFVH